MDFLLRFVFVDVPEAFLLLTIGLAMFNRSVFEKKKQALLFSILSGGFGEFLGYYEISYQPKVLTMFLSTTLIFYLLYKPGLLKSVFMSTAAMGSLIMAEFILLVIYNSQHLYWMDILSTDALMTFIRILYLSILLIFAVILRVMKFDIRRVFPRNRYNRYLFLLILVGSIEFLLILFMNTSFFLRNNNSVLGQVYTPQFQLIFQLLILALFILIVFLFRIYLTLTIHRVEEETGTPYLNSIHDMLTAIRSFKHDSMNHYTAINGFLKKGLYDLAKEYVEQLLHEIVVTEKTVDSSAHILEGIKNPAVSSLLQSKMALCLAERIHLTMNITTSNQFTHIKTYDLIKVLGNLMDNAIRATSYELEENRYIRLDWGQSERELFLTIENSGPGIPKDKLNEVFSIGYTTKKNGEGGLGLTIVKSVTERYGGNVEVFSENGITRIHVSFNNR
ncbi:sensor histidine kinase [Brevibacillus invocatus]|uniref:sensor histidine kinase n=1 Tax=Brevibacillus invocatus TaxID=173959 RepID=UPI002041FCDC|nr:ATP-binding protein [Brevibacillus invocatus]MCM3079714.1 GHKL domain-containing protein [Brevibacillus invocatus]MCM3431485.1 GHKL domain-containing protein [Brevibacillus invocatus]